MRHLLIDHARTRKSAKRGGLRQKVPLDKLLIVAEEKSVDLIAIDAALEKLEHIDARRARVVELRYFGGLSVEETAEVLRVSPKTVKRDWSVARLWLHHEIAGHRQK